MNDEEIAQCQQAITLANTGQKQVAYQQFCALFNQGNKEDVTLLYWLAYTTPVWQEAYHSLGEITRLEPGHPKLQELRKYIIRKHGYAPVVNLEPVLHCPFCRYVGPARIQQKVSVGGWIVFVLLLLSFFLFWLCWIGLLIKDDYYVCGNCGIKLGGR